ncbi:uncharacterized protein [Engystomops pustulosus]|uniref:uncharacterized protein n=1 Tax=Engystomops pustulosus TaxID=76066 RepID=UPI003AFA2F0C
MNKNLVQVSKPKCTESKVYYTHYHINKHYTISEDYSPGSYKGPTTRSRTSSSQSTDGTHRVSEIPAVTCVRLSPPVMAFVKILAMFLVAVLKWQSDSASITAPQCPPNSTYESIQWCQSACDNLDSDTKTCILDEIFCACNEGFIAKHGLHFGPVECIKAEECNVTCRPNKHYEPRASGCQPTCDHPTVPEICDKKKSPQCVCNEGYILSGSKCVQKDECIRPKP